jgi:hypothetical protein
MVDVEVKNSVKKIYLRTSTLHSTLEFWSPPSTGPFRHRAALRFIRDAGRMADTWRPVL